MALPDNSYISWEGLQTAFLNKDDGTPLSAGYVEFYKDVARTVPKNVYQQVQLPSNEYDFVNIGSVITLSSVGTFQSPNDGTDIRVWAYPFDADGNIELYYLKVFSSAAVFQFSREAEPPNVIGNSDIEEFQGSENIISNPQFVETLLPASLTNVYSVSGSAAETEIVPDWSIITDGTGTVTVTQEPLTSVIPSDAPYAIRISSTGITNLILRQQITQSPRLLGTGFISGSLVAKTASGASAVPLIMRYVASNLYTVDLVTQSTNADGNYYTLRDTPSSKAIATTNTQSPNAPGYINIDIVIPVLTDVGITSVQVVSTEGTDFGTPFIQESTPRQIDHLFHYYKDPLLYKPIPSYLVGWDFPINPAQFGSTVAAQAVGANKSYYAWDQTILFQSANSGISASRSSIPTLQLQSAVASTQMALIQYIEGSRAKEVIFESLFGGLSVNVRCESTVAQTLTISLWRTTNGTLPNMNTNDSLVTSLNASGHPAVVAGWTEITRGSLGNAQFTTSASIEDFGFSGWQTALAADSQTATFFAIVIGTNAIVTPNVLQVMSVSLVPGDVATIPAPQTYDEVLRDCRHYYEMSYNGQGTTDPRGSATSTGIVFAEQTTTYTGGNTLNFIPRGFFVTYKVIKRAAPTIYIYSEAGTVANVTGFTYTNGAIVASGDVLLSNWSASGTGLNSIMYLPVNVTARLATLAANTTPEGFMRHHYVADARLGIV